jgi:hypothetical protein
MPLLLLLLLMLLLMLLLLCLNPGRLSHDANGDKAPPELLDTITGDSEKSPCLSAERLSHWANKPPLLAADPGNPSKLWH